MLWEWEILYSACTRFSTSTVNIRSSCLMWKSGKATGQKCLSLTRQTLVYQQSWLSTSISKLKETLCISSIWKNFQCKPKSHYTTQQRSHPWEESMKVKNVGKPSGTGMILSDIREALGISSVWEAFCMSSSLIKHKQIHFGQEQEGRRSSCGSQCLLPENP